MASIFKAIQNVAPSQLADRELFDFENLSLDRNEDERLFEGDNIQVGQSERLADIGLPTAPQTQDYNPKFGEHLNTETSDTNERQKIPVINPMI